MPQFIFDAWRPYRAPCIVCGAWFDSFYPPAHTHCSPACWRARQPDDGEWWAWLRKVTESNRERMAAA